MPDWAGGRVWRRLKAAWRDFLDSIRDLFTR